jgi:hypothetical protein
MHFFVSYGTWTVAFRFSSFYFPFWGYTPEHPWVDKILRCLQFNCNPIYEIIFFLKVLLWGLQSHCSAMRTGVWTCAAYEVLVAIIWTSKYNSALAHYQQKISLMLLSPCISEYYVIESLKIVLCNLWNCLMIVHINLLLFFNIGKVTLFN